MVKSVDEYLSLLKKELAGSDAAVIQDALADAEEHLRTALAQAISGNPNTSEAEAIPSIAEKYGSPQEVAEAYRQMEARVPAGFGRSTHTGHRSIFSRFFGVFADLPGHGGAPLPLSLPGHRHCVLHVGSNRRFAVLGAVGSHRRNTSCRPLPPVHSRHRLHRRPAG